MKQLDTPKRARILQIHQMKASGTTKRFYKKLFDELGVSRTTAYRVIKSGRERRIQHSDQPDHRGNSNKLSNEDLKHMESLVKDSGKDGRRIDLNTLKHELNTDACFTTLRKALDSMGYHHCIACRTRK
jgi:transposase